MQNSLINMQAKLYWTQPKCWTYIKEIFSYFFPELWQLPRLVQWIIKFSIPITIISLSSLICFLVYNKISLYQLTKKKIKTSFLFCVYHAKNMLNLRDLHWKVRKTGKTGGFSDKTGKNRNEFKKQEKQEKTGKTGEIGCPVDITDNDNEQ